LYLKQYEIQDIRTHTKTCLWYQRCHEWSSLDHDWRTDYHPSLAYLLEGLPCIRYQSSNIIMIQIGSWQSCLSY